MGENSFIFATCSSFIAVAGCFDGTAASRVLASARVFREASAVSPRRGTKRTSNARFSWSRYLHLSGRKYTTTAICHHFLRRRHGATEIFKNYWMHYVVVGQRANHGCNRKSGKGKGREQIKLNFGLLSPWAVLNSSV